VSGEIRIRAERKCGEILAATPKNKGTRGQLTGRDVSGGIVTVPPEESTQTIADLGISKRQSSGWQKLAELPAEQFEKAVDEIEIPSLFSVLNHRAQGTGQNEWYTPAEYIQIDSRPRFDHGRPRTLHLLIPAA
jgi:hypothetical protein